MILKRESYVFNKFPKSNDETIFRIRTVDFKKVIVANFLFHVKGIIYIFRESVLKKLSFSIFSIFRLKLTKFRNKITFFTAHFTISLF